MSSFVFAQDPVEQDSIQPQEGYNLGELAVPNPPTISSKYTYDPLIDRYIYTESVGNFNIDYPIILTPDEYEQLVLRESIQEYYKTKLDAIEGKKEGTEETRKNILPDFYVNSGFFETIFGGNTIEVVPQGSVEMDIGFLYNKQDNPSLSPRNRSNFTFDFDQRISLSLLGKVGKRLQVTANYDTESTFDFQNQIKLEYTPTEDDIIRKIEVGNISMPLNSSLITGAQSLFGVKTELQFGKTTVTAVFSEQKSQRTNVTAQGGGTIEEFELFALDYDENRHFFLGHYFRNNYDQTLEQYPFISSNIQITRIEVWVTNRNNTTQDVRNIVALQDMGETGRLGEPSVPVYNTPNALPDNGNNGLNPETIGSGSTLNDNIRDIATVESGFGSLSAVYSEGVDYAKLENARKLVPGQEYHLNSQLGYISLNQKLNNDEVLAVAYQYTSAGQVYQVGEFANDGVSATDVDENTGAVTNQNLVLKMLKSNLTTVSEPIWDLMMKNIYPLGAYQLSQEGFKLDILYTDPSPINYISSADGGTTPLPSNVEQTALIQVFELDKLNVNNDPQIGGDGFFDFYPGITVNTQTGSVIFTKVEPFGEFLYDKLGGGGDYTNPVSYNANQTKYVYRSLYTSTKAVAMEDADKNKFQLKGRYKSEGGGGIPLGAFNVPRGSVTVTAGGRQLVEGVDYTVDYQLGRVEILDEALKASNTPINVSVENNAVFGQQSRRFMGLNVEHKFNEKFLLGATLLNLRERPLTQKATYGYEPINNTIVGMNGNFSTELPFLTRLVNKLPNIDTDAPSSLSVRGEFAYLLPGAPDRTNLNGEATTYIDDFEASQTAIDVKSPLAWNLSSTPRGFSLNQTGGDDPVPSMNQESGYRRAKLAWYTIDPIFYTSERPSGISDNDLSTIEASRAFIREVVRQDIAQGQNTVLNTLDLAYYPNQRGPYNNIPTLNTPQENWGGITRALNTTDFEQANVEYIEFWLQDPFFDDTAQTSTNSGTLYLNIGSISEDVLKDGRKLYENGMPADGVNTPATVTPTSWGNVPTNQALIYAFDTEGQERTNQDIGLDGLSDAGEATATDPNTGLPLYDNGDPNDPAGDNYTYYLNTSGNVLERYLDYNGTQGNSPVTVTNTNRGSTTQPDVEDINRDNTMNTIDSYYQYEVDISDNMAVGTHPFLRDENFITRSMPNGNQKRIRWLQFRVPLRGNHAQAFNGISDFRSVRFMRMFLSGFTDDIVMRFGTLELVRGDWRTYTQSLDLEPDNTGDPTTDFESGAVNEQENPNYVLPPGVSLEELYNNNSVIRQNEQSLALRVNELEAQDARAVYKNIQIDMLQFKKLRMFLHAQQYDNVTSLSDNAVSAMVRMGNDLTDNYYEIQKPLLVSLLSASTVDAVWPDANSIEIPLEVLKEVKASKISTAGINTDISYFDVDTEGNLTEVTLDVNEVPTTNIPDGFYRIAIKGNPSLGNIRTLMLGVKNNTNLDQSAEVWFNELRLSDMDNKGGWAALASADLAIADFASVSATGKRSTFGFGSLEQGPNERSRDDVKQYDVVTDVNVGQLLPKKWGIQIPFNYGIGEEIITPKFDPLYQDIELETIIDQDSENEDFYRNRAENYTKRKSINFIGVRKERTTEAKPRFYDVENFTLSYSYNQVDHRDYEVANFLEQQVRAGATYGYGFKQKSIEPFKKIKFFNRSKYFDLLKEVNFNLLPNNISVSTNYSRLFNKQRFRNVDDIDGIPLPDLYKRNYLFDWQYNISHNLTKSLQLNFTATRNNIVRNYITLGGIVDNTNTVWDGFFEVGDPNRHSQQFQLNYELPINKLPVFSFVKSTYSYTGDFQWQKGPDGLNNGSLTNIPRLGNSVQNAQTHNLTASLDMKKFYKYIGLERKDFKKTYARKLRPKKDRKSKRLSFLEAKDSLTESQSLKRDKKIEKLTEQLDVIERKSKTKPKTSIANKMYNVGVDMLTSIKKVQVTYNENNGSYIPGYLNGLGFLGTTKPSLGYVFGAEADNLRFEAARKGWLTLYQDFNEQYSRSKVRQLNISANVEPIKKLKIDLIANRNYQHNYTENYRVVGADPVTGEGGSYQSLTPNTFGNFSISTFLLPTAFSKSNENESAAFNEFRDNRKTIALRLAQRDGIDITDPSNFENGDVNGFPLGYGKTSQQVLLPAFLAAYSGQDASSTKLGAFRNIPIPNWTVKYTGLMDLKWFKKRFKRFSISHAYKADYTINQFRTNLDLQSNPSDNLDQEGNFKSRTLFSNINLTEQFTPLLKVDFEMKNSIRVGLEYRKDRALSLSFDNNLMTEIQGDEYIVQLGYRIKDLRFKTRFAGKATTLKGDLNIKTDLSLRDNKTIVRYLDVANNQITAGQRLLSGKLTADYALTKNLTTLLYFDYTFSDAVISTSFPQTTMRGGFTLRYNFGN